MIALILLSILSADGPKYLTLERVGRLDHPPIREASGMVKSRKHKDVFWVHNDSGNPPKLFAVRRDGTLIREYGVAAPNVDWEDISTDDSGHLYIGEIGNNDARLPLRPVYMLDEPDPVAAEPRSLRVLTASYYQFSKGNRFDAEGLMIDGGRALLVSKTFDGKDAEVYAIPMAPPAPLFKPATPELIGKLTGFDRPVTGANLSSDGKHLAVCATNMVGVYERSLNGTWLQRFLSRFRPDDGQIEAIAWDGDDLMMAGENREIYRVAARTWRNMTASGRRP